MEITVRTFYRFAPLAAPSALRAPVLAFMEARDIRGTITFAGEGINATVSGACDALDALLAFLERDCGIPVRTYRDSAYGAQPFRRSKVKVKRELVSLGAPADASTCAGTLVSPPEWNALLAAPDVVLIDTRNDYEFALGRFEGALNPATRHFRQMAAFTDRHLAAAEGKRIAMYCTGGIRCEKYAAFLAARGFRHILHLKGGILAYLEAIPPGQSRWQGTCFVFDERTAVGYGLKAA
ncbi:MAG: rhodanese-like domain-containing protein [Alphaproteobacteria bacterium]